MRIIITGVPGSGKTTLAKALAKKMQVEYLDLNALAKKHAVLRKKGREFEIHLKKLEKFLKKFLKDKKNFVLEGHLACEIKIPCDLVVIFRCNPLALMKRLKKRGYKKDKIIDNALAEAQDYFVIGVREKYGKKFIEVDSTQRVSANCLLQLINRKKTLSIGWNKELLALASQGF